MKTMFDFINQLLDGDIPESVSISLFVDKQFPKEKWLSLNKEIICCEGETPADIFTANIVFSDNFVKNFIPNSITNYHQMFNRILFQPSHICKLSLDQMNRLFGVKWITSDDAWFSAFAYNQSVHDKYVIAEWFGKHIGLPSAHDFNEKKPRENATLWWRFLEPYEASRLYNIAFVVNNTKGDNLS